MAERLAGMFHRRYAEADDEYQRALAVLLQQPLAEFGMEKSLLEAVEVRHVPCPCCSEGDQNLTRNGTLTGDPSFSS